MWWQVWVALATVWLADCSLAQEDSCICLEQFGTEDLYNPTFFTTAPGDDERIFVGEQRGFLWVYDRDGTRNVEPLLDVSDRFELATVDELGLLGCAFHQDYINNRKFYVYYTRNLEEPIITLVSEFQTDVDNPDIADMASERVIIEFEQQSQWHDGGEIFFGHDDGFLYIYLGDGGSVAENAQDMTTHLGKALRIDVDTGDDDVPYLIPEDNPFVDETEYLPEIYALGFRNPWRCTMDPGDSETGVGRGRIFCADVGAAFCEEVDIVIPGGNYAWPVKECIFCYPPTPPEDCSDEPEVSPGEEVLPIFWYTDWAGSQAIIGGHIYRGSGLPDYYGDYIYSDWAVRDQGGIQRLREDVEDWENAGIPLCDVTECGDGLIAEHQLYSYSFGQDQDLEVYVLESATLAPYESGGVVYKLVPPNGKKLIP